MDEEEKMKFKCGKDGVYVDGESNLIGMSVSREKMEMIEELLWPVTSQEMKPSAGGRVMSDSNSLHSSDTYYTPQINDSFNHLSCRPSAEIDDDLYYDPCPEWCEGSPNKCLDISWDVEMCDYCVEARGTDYGY